MPTRSAPAARAASAAGPWVNTQVYSNVNGLAELDSRQLGQQCSSVYKVVGLACFDFAGDSLLALGQLSHYTPSTLRPMLRAEPAIVRTAASISARSEER